MGEYRRSGEGTSSQTRGTSEVGITLHHGVAARYVTVRSPSFRRRPCRLSLGDQRFCRRGGARGHPYRRHLLHRHRRGRNTLQRLSVPDTFIHYAPQGPAVDEGIQNPSSCLVEAKGHPGLRRPKITPTPDQRCDRAQLPEELRRTHVQLLHRWDEHHRPGWRRYTQQRPTNDAFEPRILEGQSNFYFSYPEGCWRLCRILVVGELHRFLGGLLRRRGILRVPMAISPSFHDCVDSTP